MHACNDITVLQACARSKPRPCWAGELLLLLLLPAAAHLDGEHDVHVANDVVVLCEHRALAVNHAIRGGALLAEVHHCRARARKRIALPSFMCCTPRQQNPNPTG
jgi:hypothetical protein